MIKRVIIIPYKLGSASAKALQEELRQGITIPVLLVKKSSTKYQPRWTDYVINWGCSADWDFISLDNKDGNQTATDKLKTFQAISSYNVLNPMYQINIPEWTDNWETAFDWFLAGDLVVGRLTLSGHSGEGICLYHEDDVLGDATFDPEHLCKLYTKYKKKKNEYRVHIFNGEVIDITQKKKRKDAEFVDTKIRNHKNGWVYAREGITIPDDLEQQALNTIQAVDLKFGAVDLIWNEHENKSYVLEVNTAPGLVGTTLSKYVDAFVKDINNV